MHRNDEYDYMFKMAVFGADNVLKYNLITKFSNGVLSALSPNDLGYNVKSIKTLNPSYVVKLQIWQAPNDVLRPNSAPAHLRALHHAIIVYDMANPNLDDLKKYLSLMQQYYSEHPPLMAIVGVQSTAQSTLANDQIKHFAETNNCIFTDGINLTSAKHAEQFFQNLVSAQLQKMGVKLAELAPNFNKSCSLF